MGKIRVCVIGVGLIGKSHLEQYAKIGAADVVAVADINEVEARYVAERFGVPDAYTNFRELLERDDIDAVDVCLHNNFHAPVTLEALRAGKHVYCEKPMAGSYVDALEMYETARQLGRKLSIQLASLYTKETKAAKRLIEEGKLGKLYHARSTGHRRRGRPFVDGYGTAAFVSKETAGGGALYDMGVYHIAQLLWLLGLPEVRRISGKAYQEMDMDPGRGESSGFNVEEFAVGLVKFADGATLDIVEAWAIHLDKFESSFIVGSEGGLRLDPLSFHTTSGDIDVNTTFELGSADWRWHQLNPDIDVYDGNQQHWIAALQGRVELLPTADIALQTMLISEGIYLSDRLGREVTAEEVREHSQSTAVRV